MSAVGGAPDEQVERSDAELIAAVRAGEQSAYATLWTRHEGAAHRLARQIARPADAEELVSESFYRVLRAINSGGGPDGAFRPYLLSTLRRANIDTGRSYHQRVNLTGEDHDLETEHAASAADVAMARDEDSAAWRAWASLPEASRTLLWHLLVEEETPAQIAPLLGTTPNGVSSRAVRAKERLRQAFLQQHVRTADSQQCEWTRQRLGEYVRNALSERSEQSVRRHLDSCKRCKAAALYLADVNQAMHAAVVPVVLGGAALAGKYLAAGGATHAAGLLWLGRLRPRGRTATVTASAGAAASILAAALVAFALTAGDSASQHDSRAAVVQPNDPSAAHAAPVPPASHPSSSSPHTRHPSASSPTPSRPAPSRPPPSSSRAAPPPAPAPSTRARAHSRHTSSPPPASPSPTTRTPTPRSSPPSSQSTSSARPEPPPASTSAPPSPTHSTPPASPSSTAPTSESRTVTLTSTARFMLARVSSGWAIQDARGPAGSRCSSGTQWALCLAPSGSAPYSFTVVVTGTGPGELRSTARPHRVQL